MANSWPFFQPGKIGLPLPGLGPRTTSRAGFGFRSLNRPNLGCWRPKNRTGGFGLKWPTDRLIKILPKSPPFRPADRPLFRTRFYFFAICKPPGTEPLQKGAPKRPFWLLLERGFRISKNGNFFRHFLRKSAFWQIFGKIWPISGHSSSLAKSVPP